MMSLHFFTSVPTDPALNLIKDLLEKDEKLNDRTVLSVQNIIELLGFCLHDTFLFKTSFMNRLRVHLWDHQSVPLLPICTWNVLRERLLVLLSTPQGMV